MITDKAAKINIFEVLFSIFENVFFSGKVVLLVIKEFHGFKDDLKII